MNKRVDINWDVGISAFSIVACVLSDFASFMFGLIFASDQVPIFYITAFKALPLLLHIIVLLFTYDKLVDILIGCCHCRRPCDCN